MRSKKIKKSGNKTKKKSKAIDDSLTSRKELSEKKIITISIIVLVVAVSLTLILLFVNKKVSSEISSEKPPCSEGNSCTVDLSDCSEDQKANAWKGKTQLNGVLKKLYYLDKFDIACSTELPQAWPLNQEKDWWCGEVIC